MRIRAAPGKVVDRDMSGKILDGKSRTKRRFFDAFAGMGGIRLGMEAAGFECAGSCELDERARKTYAENFQNQSGFNQEPKYRDIRHMTHLPSRLDVLCAGFPCTPFSTIGRRQGFEDSEKGRLFFELIRLMGRSKPKAVLFENVKALVHHDGGRAFSAVLDTLSDLGYRISWRVLNSADFGLAQSRNRVFIVGFRSPVFAKRFSFPEGKYGDSRSTIRSVMERDVSSEFDATKAMAVGYIVKLKQRGVNKGGRFLPALHAPGDVSRTLVTNGQILIVDGKRLRRLTPRECARLQGFPDWFKLAPAKTVAYRQLGNSVPIPIVEAIGKEMSAAMV